MSLGKLFSFSEPLSNDNSTCLKGLLKVLNEKYSVLIWVVREALVLLSLIPVQACSQHPKPTNFHFIHSDHKHVLSTNYVTSIYSLSTYSGQAVCQG